MYKDTNFFSDIKSFFKNDSSNRAILHLSTLFEGLKLSERSLFGTPKRDNCQYPLLQVLSLLVMFPCFMIRNPYAYESSSLGRLFGGDKDVFYRFLNSDSYDWRHILMRVMLTLWTRSVHA